MVHWRGISPSEISVKRKRNTMSLVCFMDKISDFDTTHVILLFISYSVQYTNYIPPVHYTDNAAFLLLNWFKYILLTLFWLACST